jgi:hypothetical protein
VSPTYSSGSAPNWLQANALGASNPEPDNAINLDRPADWKWRLADPLRSFARMIVSPSNTDGAGVHR